MKLNKSIMSWQRVSLGSRLCSDPVFFDERTWSTAVPHECVPSPVFCSNYKNDISCINSALTLIKFADGMTLVGRLKDQFFLSQYYLKIELLNCCFRSSFLELNIAKSKELVLGRKLPGPVSNQEFEIVKSFKYLGTSTDQNLTFFGHVILCTGKLSSALSSCKTLMFIRTFFKWLIGGW